MSALQGAKTARIASPDKYTNDSHSDPKPLVYNDLKLRYSGKCFVPSRDEHER